MDLEIESIRVVLPPPAGVARRLQQQRHGRRGRLRAVAQRSGRLANEGARHRASVNQADYDHWRANFGETAGGGAGSGQAAAVPEPAAWLLLCVCVAWLLVRLRRDR